MEGRVNTNNPVFFYFFTLILSKPACKLKFTEQKGKTAMNLRNYFHVKR